jgi:hypothetical protein
LSPPQSFGINCKPRLLRGKAFLWISWRIQARTKNAGLSRPQMEIFVPALNCYNRVTLVVCAGKPAGLHPFNPQSACTTRPAPSIAIAGSAGVDGSVDARWSATLFNFPACVRGMEKLPVTHFVFPPQKTQTKPKSMKQSSL